MLLLSISIAALAIGLISLTITLFYKSRQIDSVKGLSQQIEKSSEQLQILRSEITELRTGLLSVGKRVIKVEEQSQELMEQQAALKYEDPNAKMYSRAIKMIGLGADIDEVIRECELPKAEAALLFSLHKQKDR